LYSNKLNYFRKNDYYDKETQIDSDFYKISKLLNVKKKLIPKKGSYEAFCYNFKKNQFKEIVSICNSFF